MFKRLFKKNGKEEISNHETAELSYLAEQVDKSILAMMSNTLFMHYYNEGTPVNPDDQGWQNLGIFFWSAQEAFERKSLPPDFSNYEKKHFVIHEIPKGIDVSKGEVIPWFGMPGGGDKYFFSKDESYLHIEELVASNVIQYVELVELTEENVSILTNRDNYRLLLDDATTRYEPSSDSFFFKDTKVSLGVAYELGGVKIIRN